MSKVQITAAGLLAVDAASVLHAAGFRVGRPDAETISIELLDNNGLALAVLEPTEVPVGKRINLLGFHIKLGVQFDVEPVAKPAESEHDGS